MHSAMDKIVLNLIPDAPGAKRQKAARSGFAPPSAAFWNTEGAYEISFFKIRMNSCLLLSEELPVYSCAIS